MKNVDMAKVEKGMFEVMQSGSTLVDSKKIAEAVVQYCVKENMMPIIFKEGKKWCVAQ